MQKKLQRSKNDRVIAGICGGIGEFLNIDSTLVRIIWVFTFLLGGAGLLAYLIGLLIVPERDERSDYIEVGSETSEGSSTTTDTGKWLGVALIIFGVLFLFKNVFGWINFIRFWPVALIVIGVGIVVKGFRSN